MKVSIDGGVTWIEVAEVRVEAPDHEDRDFTFSMTMTNEGIIQDWNAKGEGGARLHTGYAEWGDVCDVIGERG